MTKLGVNIDHVATLRQARAGIEPEPVFAARACEDAGADSIVVHLREDRRHICDGDLKALKKIVRTRLNLEMSANPEIVKIACKVLPDQATLVPEKRQELTTEGGLNLKKDKLKVEKVIKVLRAKKILVSLFLDPDEEAIDIAKDIFADAIELHTGNYANALTAAAVKKELARLTDAAAYACRLGLAVNAGHGLNYLNARPVANIAGVQELNIGHSIISRAVFVGLERAVKEMLELIR